MLTGLQRSAIRNRLPYACRRPASRWKLADAEHFAIADRVLSLVDTGRRTFIEDPSAEVLKTREGKAVLALDLPDQFQPRKCVIKLFFMQKLSSQIKYSRYALDEASNLLLAQERGLNTPPVIACGNVHNSLGLCSVSILVLEYVEHTTSSKDVFANTTPERQRQILDDLKPFLLSLYLSGCHHIDLHAGNILISDRIYLIDLQHAKFLGKPNLESLMFQIAHLLRSLKVDPTNSFVDDWLAEVVHSTGISEVEVIEQARHWFRYYSGARLSRAQRKAIARPSTFKAGSSGTAARRPRPDTESSSS